MLCTCRRGPPLHRFRVHARVLLRPPPQPSNRAGVLCPTVPARLWQKMPSQRNPWETNGSHWKRWDDGAKRGGRDKDDIFDELGEMIKRAGRQAADLRKENEVLRKRLREENGHLHSQLKKTQEELTRTLFPLSGCDPPDAMSQ